VIPVNEPWFLYTIIRIQQFKHILSQDEYYYETLAILKSIPIQQIDSDSPNGFACCRSIKIRDITPPTFNEPVTLQCWDDTKSSPWICYVKQEWYLTQIKSNQIKSNQIKSNQIKSNRIRRFLFGWVSSQIKRNDDSSGWTNVSPLDKPANEPPERMHL